MIRFVLCLMLAVLPPAMLPAPVNAGGAADTVYQVSVIDALLAGAYDGSVHMDDLLQQGDLGLGTFNGLDGEMVVLDGEVWQVPVSGEPRKMPADASTPFASVVRFEPDMVVDAGDCGSLKELGERVDAALPSVNLLYAARFDGRFRSLRARSVPAQHRPYPPLAEVVKHQAVFELDEVEGTLIGLRCPPYAKGVNVPGWHWHFLSADRRSGGHVLDLSLAGGAVRVDVLRGLRLDLPDQPGFAGANLAPDRTEALKRVEQGD